MKSTDSLDLGKLRKTTDLLSLVQAIKSKKDEISVIVRLKPGADLPEFAKLRSTLVPGLVTANIFVADLFKLDACEDVVGFNCAKVVKTVR